jgi:hypothetical protein
LMGRRGRRLTRGDGNDNYDVRKVLRRAARSRGAGRDEWRRGANQSLVVERTRRLRLDADIVAVAWEAAPVAAARGSGPVRHKAVQRRRVVSWEHAVDSGKGCSTQRQLGALASRRTVELRSTRLWRLDGAAASSGAMSAQRREEQHGGKKWTLLRLTVQRIRHGAVTRTWGGEKYLKAASVSGKRRWKDDKWAP